MERIHMNRRRLSVAAFSFLFAYLLSFLFEGQVLYGLLDAASVDAAPYVLAAIIAHFFGLFCCGFLCRSPRGAKTAVLAGMAVCLAVSPVFFRPPSSLWLGALAVAGFSAGCAVAAWGCFLREYTPKNRRLKSCADMLIYSNLIMTAVNMATARLSPRLGLALSILCLLTGLALTCLLPGGGRPFRSAAEPKKAASLRRPMGVLFLFVAVITVDSGLMYQVINPAFEHLTDLVSWYWAVPYIAALVFMRNFPVSTTARRSRFLYVGMGMIMAAFLAFMLLQRSAADYLVVDTLMLGACGIFDLFWWSIIGETLDYGENPVSVFGVGLSANVFGVLLGDVIGVSVRAVRLPEAQVAVIALCVVCVTLMILPPLNRQLTLLLKTHAYLSAYSTLPEQTQARVAAAIAPLDPLTEREADILRLLLEGLGNREIAAAGFIKDGDVYAINTLITNGDHLTEATEVITAISGTPDPALFALPKDFAEYKPIG